MHNGIGICNHKGIGNHKSYALKVDLLKASNMVNCDFIMVVLKVIGCHSYIIMWIKECATTHSFSINISKGLRQGDLISFYLLVIVIKAFSCIMRNVTKEESFKYQWRCWKVKITHLCFTNNLLIFCTTQQETITIIKKKKKDYHLLRMVWIEG